MMSGEAEPGNIGNPTEMTMLEFAREIIEVTGSRSKIVFRPLPQDDPRQRRPDITRAGACFLGNGRPKFPCATGLSKLLNISGTRFDVGTWCGNFTLNA